MSDERPAAGEEFDRDIDVRKVVWTGVWLAAVIAVSMVAMWFFAGSLRSALREADPPPSPLPEAGVRQLPPAPRLQESPEQDLAAMRAEEQRLLTSYGWVNEAGAIARIPVDRAIELIAERGLPETPPQPAAPAASEGSHVP